MSLKLCILGSGSSGNCQYLASEQGRILIDAGLSCKETARRLEMIGVALADVDAVCLTHEHEDHKSSLGVMHRRYGSAVYANSGTIEAVSRNGKTGELAWNVFTTGVSFRVKDIEIEPFSVPHDSYDPVGFIVASGSSRLGIVTDMGVATGLIRERLKGCHAIIIESNHDEQLLKEADRPWSLKQRIAGRQGHLSNRQAGELLAEIASPALSHVFLAHLSSDCNDPELALQTVRTAVTGAGHQHIDIRPTYPDRPTELITL